jgi:signal transduction histidine kinase
MNQLLMPPLVNAPGDLSQRLDCLLDVARVVNSSLDLDVVIDRILDYATRILGAESGSMMLLQEGSTRLRVHAARGPRAGQIVGREQERGQGVAGWVAEHGEPLLLLGANSDSRFNRVCSRQDVRDSLSVPLRTESEVLGVLNLSNGQGETPFAEEDLGLLTALANHASVAVRNARSFQRMRRQHETLERLLEEVNRAQEEERLRLALYVQEGPGLAMSAALDRVQAARRALAAGQDSPDEALGETEEALQGAIRETRLAAFNLQSPRPEGLDLRGALQQYVGEFEQQTGISTRYSHHGPDVRPSATFASCIYRVAQEALAHVGQQAETGQVSVSLDLGGNACTLEVRDDSRAPEGPEEPEGPEVLKGPDEPRRRSLLTLQERVRLIGGRLTVDTRPGLGTTVRVTAPLMA